MEAYKGSPLFFGHRAWGSQLREIFTFMVMSGVYAYLWHWQPVIFSNLHLIHSYPQYAYLGSSGAVLLDLLYKHYRITYVVTTQELMHKTGIIASTIHRYTYNQIQEATSIQTLKQRLELWGTMVVTMLINKTGQATPEVATFQYIHRPMMIANLIMENIKVGN